MKIYQFKRKNLSAKSSISFSGYTTKKIIWKDVQALLSTDEAVVELIHITKFNKEDIDTIYYGALVLTKESITPQFVVLKNGNQLEKRYLAY